MLLQNDLSFWYLSRCPNLTYLTCVLGPAGEPAEPDIIASGHSATWKLDILVLKVWVSVCTIWRKFVAPVLQLVLSTA